MIDGGDAVRRLALNLAGFAPVKPLASRLVGGVGAILMLHRVTRAPDGPLGMNRHLSIRPEFLDSLLGAIGRAGHRLVSLDDALDRLNRKAPEPFVVITADDGYRDNLIEALPVLERHAAPITIYAAPGLVDGAIDLWWEVVERIAARGSVVDLAAGGIDRSMDFSDDRQRMINVRELVRLLLDEIAPELTTACVRALARQSGVAIEPISRDLIMDWDELRQAASHPLVTIGAHTVTHPNLKRLPTASARSEMSRSREILRQQLGRPIHHLAFPFGFCTAVGAREVALAAECGFASAVTTRHGVVLPGHAEHPHALPRISVNGRFQNVAQVMTMLSGITTPLANRGRRLVTV